MLTFALHYPMVVMLEALLKEKIILAVRDIYGADAGPESIQIQKTRPDFTGDLTVVVFPLLRHSGKNPEQTATAIGEFLAAHLPEVASFNVIKGFLNLVISGDYWLGFFKMHSKDLSFGHIEPGNEAPVVVEYSAPNTNKPLHLGHVRNNLLGWSVSEILKASGKKVVKVNLVNDRGIHISKSMLAWQKWGKGITPESAGLKGDKLVGDYYVMFDKAYKKEIEALESEGLYRDEAAKKAPLIMEAQQMLQQWEQGEHKTRKLWEQMNDWVYDGFDLTYRRMGVDFDKIYYESNTYLLGKTLVDEGLEKGVFHKKEDGSIWCDLSDEGLDEKLLLRADRTSVYITQDLGTAQLRHDDFHPSDLVYVVGNEQIYHFDVLKILLKKLGRDWADRIFHLSYGMVELPHGKMKSREGTVVDADDLMDEMFETARKTTEELGKFDDFTPEESTKLYEMLGMGALKYFMLKVDPKKTMLFNPEESLDFNGNTGPFIQYTHARIKSVLRKAEERGIPVKSAGDPPTLLESKEKNLLKLLHDYPQVIQLSAENLSPAMIANYVFDLAKEYNQFYHQHPILNEPDERNRSFRLGLSAFVARTILSATALLGIDVPERM